MFYERRVSGWLTTGLYLYIKYLCLQIYFKINRLGLIWDSKGNWICNPFFSVSSHTTPSSLYAWKKKHSERLLLPRRCSGWFSLWITPLHLVHLFPTPRRAPPPQLSNPPQCKDNVCVCRLHACASVCIIRLQCSQISKIIMPFRDMLW